MVMNFTDTLVKTFVYIRFGVEIQPTGTVSEYTATITDETLREGKKGRHKVESLKLTLRAEGTNTRHVWIEMCKGQVGFTSNNL